MTMMGRPTTFLFIEGGIEKNAKNLMSARTVSLLLFSGISIQHVYYAGLAPVLLESPGFPGLS